MDAIEEAEMPEVKARLPVELKDELKALAAKNERSLTSEVRRALRMHIEKEQA